MNLHHLEVFCAVCELGSMTKAAEHLNMTQPGVSRIISELESEFGEELFTRRNRNLYLSYHGQQCYSMASKILAQVQELSSAMCSHPMSELRIGCSTGISEYIMPKIINTFSKRYPSCRLFIDEGSADVIQEGVKDSKYGIGLVQALIVDRMIVHKPFRGDRIIAVKAPAYQLKCRKDILSFADLADEDLILTKETTNIRREIDIYASKMNIRLDPIWNCLTGATALLHVEQGFGVTMLSDKTVAESLASGRVEEIPISDFSLTRDFYRIWKVSKQLSEEEQYIMALAEEC